MHMMQKTLHGMQMGEKVMDCSNIRWILHNGRQLIVCISIFQMTQETLGLVLLLTEWILFVT